MKSKGLYIDTKFYAIKAITECLSGSLDPSHIYQPFFTQKFKGNNKVYYIQEKELKLVRFLTSLNSLPFSISFLIVCIPYFSDEGKIWLDDKKNARLYPVPGHFFTFAWKCMFFCNYLIIY